MSVPGSSSALTRMQCCFMFEQHAVLRRQVRVAAAALAAARKLHSRVGHLQLGGGPTGGGPTRAKEALFPGTPPARITRSSVPSDRDCHMVGRGQPGMPGQLPPPPGKVAATATGSSAGRLRVWAARWWVVRQPVVLEPPHPRALRQPQAQPLSVKRPGRRRGRTRCSAAGPRRANVTRAFRSAVGPVPTWSASTWAWVLSETRRPRRRLRREPVAPAAPRSPPRSPTTPRIPAPPCPSPRRPPPPRAGRCP